MKKKEGMKMKSKIKTKIISCALLSTMCSYTLPVFAFTKEETVYSKLDSEGKTYQTLVSTHLENKEKSEEIHDITDLFNIKNTNGEEEFTQEGNSLIWKADKKDIYYQGESQKELPIECKMKYELDGKEVKAEEILGKSGHVKITIQYRNKEEHLVNMNGQNQKMYTPFVVVAGTILQNDNNKNIEISSGKIINDGSKSIAVGIALPGLQESLKVNPSDIEIPNNIEITMDTENFECGNIITFVTPKVLEEEDLSIFNQFHKMYEQVNTLETASNQIQEGSQSLVDGTKQLASGTKELKEGTDTAYQGAKQIKAEVAKATKQLVNDKSEALDQTTLNAIGEKAKQVANLSDTQKAQIGNQAVSQVAELTLTQAQKQQIAANVKAGLEANANYKALPAEQQAMVLQFSQNSAIAAAQTTAQETAKKVANQTARQVAQQTAIQVAATTAQSVAKEVANQVKTTAQNQVITQMNTLGEGLNQLTNGLGSLNKGTNALQNGANELNQGANTLAQGIRSFNEEGIKKICNFINGDIKETSERVEKLTELSKEYNHFTMLNGDNSGNVKFIMIIDAIKKQENKEETKEPVILPTEKEKIEKSLK